MSLEQLAKDLVETGLLSAAEVAAAQQALAAKSGGFTAEALAKELVRGGKLSKHQAATAFQGKAKSLFLGDYVLIEPIGAGGMGQVFKALHRRMKREVALKVMSAAAMQDPAAVKRFEREVQAAARLEHHNIVTAFDAGQAGKTHFLVMQLVDGESLAEIVKRRGPLTVDRAVDCVLQTAAGLEFAHRQGVIHRDVKPANLLLDKRGTIKILDMGLARFEGAGEALTVTEQVMGTVDFMSPEQATDAKHADARADVYSLGCTLWYLLTGRRIFEGDTLISRLIKHREEPPPPLSPSRPDVPPALEQVYRRMVAKQQSQRFQSMAEVIAALAPSAIGAPATSLAPAATVSLPSGDDRELNVFLQGVRSNPNSHPGQTSQPAGRGTAVQTARAAAANADGDTDPKSQITFVAPVVRPASGPGRSAQRANGDRLLYWAAGIAVASVVAVASIAVLKSRRIADATGPTQTTAKLPEQTAPQRPLTLVDDGKAAESRPTTATAPAIEVAAVPARVPFDAAAAKGYQETWSKQLGAAVEYENNLGMTFRLIPPGEFDMGAGADELGPALAAAGKEPHWQECVRNEAPRHRVALTQPYYIGTTEVTQDQFQLVVWTNPSHFSQSGKGRPLVAGQVTTHLPVESVSWDDAVKFCVRLSMRENLTACYVRNGSVWRGSPEPATACPPRPNGSSPAAPARKRSTGRPAIACPPSPFTAPPPPLSPRSVATLAANPFGLYDMAGNVWEWTQDQWEPGQYAARKGATTVNPLGVSTTNTMRVYRGGSWFDDVALCRSASRHAREPDDANPFCGFRVMRMAGPPQ